MKAISPRRVAAGLLGLGLLLAMCGVLQDIGALQPGLETPDREVALRAASEAEAASLGVTRPITDYASFDVTAPDGAKITVRASEGGHAKSIVFVHGAGGGAWAWEPLFEELRDKYNLYALSLRGHFESSPVSDANTSDHARDLVAVLKAIRLRAGRPVHVVAHDWGGAIAAKAAAELPDDIASVFLIAPVMALDYSPTQALFYPNVARPLLAANLRAGRTGDAFKGGFVSAALMQSYWGRYASQPYSVEKPGLLADDGYLLERQAVLARIYADLALTDIPVRIALAKYDNAVSPTRLRDAARRLRFPLREFEGGHALQLDWTYPQLASWIDEAVGGR